MYCLDGIGANDMSWTEESITFGKMVGAILRQEQDEASTI